MTTAAQAGPTEPRPRRNPTWARDELILAMDLYTRKGMLGSEDSDVVALSDLLNALPLHVDRPDRARFRNRNAVAMKLANFASLDPAYAGRGLDAGGAGDRRVWEDFSNRRDELQALAWQLHQGVLRGFDDPLPLPLGEVEGEDGVAEGRLLYRRHLARERDQKIIKLKKEKVFAQTGRLACETCSFDYRMTYGPLGEGYIECHHIVPLSEAGESTTRLADLLLVCANCHRMLHSRHGWVRPDQLRAMITRVAGREDATPTDE